MDDWTADRAEVGDLRRATSRLLLIPLAVATVLLAPLSPAVSPAQASASDAEARSKQARAHVRALVDEYREAETQVAVGLSRLSAAFELADSAIVDADRLAVARKAAAAKRDQDIRAVYASGGAAGLTATLLSAGSPTELLWRQSTNTQLMKSLLASDHAILRSAQAGSRLAERRAADAERAADEQVEALNELEAEAAKAERALTDARHTLARLDRKARRERSARLARQELAQAQREARTERRGATGEVTALGIPAEYELAYRAAGTRCVGLRWTLLAAVGQVETGHGRNVGPSSAGAQGPMQFMPGTFAAYGVDGDGDGVADIWDPEDAVFSAANYLCATGLSRETRNSAARDRTALFAYNRADWYVDLVLSTEQAILTRSAQSGQ